jgi:hypothetical protein
MPGRLPGVVPPGVGAEILGGLRNQIEDPRPLARANVERLNRSRRIVAILQAIGYAAADDGEIAVDDRRGCLL